MVQPLAAHLDEWRPQGKPSAHCAGKSPELAEKFQLAAEDRRKIRILPRPDRDGPAIPKSRPSPRIHHRSARGVEHAPRRQPDVVTHEADLARRSHDRIVVPLGACRARALIVEQPGHIELGRAVERQRAERPIERRRPCKRIVPQDRRLEWRQIIGSELQTPARRRDAPKQVNVPARHGQPSRDREIDPRPGRHLEIAVGVLDFHRAKSSRRIEIRREYHVLQPLIRQRRQHFHRERLDHRQRAGCSEHDPWRRRRPVGEAQVVLELRRILILKREPQRRGVGHLAHRRAAPQLPRPRHDVPAHLAIERHCRRRDAQAPARRARDVLRLPGLAERSQRLPEGARNAIARVRLHGRPVENPVEDQIRGRVRDVENPVPRA